MSTYKNNDYKFTKQYTLSDLQKQLQLYTYQNMLTVADIKYGKLLLEDIIFRGNIPSYFVES